MSDSLSFTRRREDGKLDFWNPERPADYTRACDVGAGYARELIAMMGADGYPPALGRVVRAITMCGEFGGVEIGFFEEIAVMAAGLRINYPACQKAA